MKDIHYLYFDKYTITPMYEFGYRLSYTMFEYASEVAEKTSNLTSWYETSIRAVGGREDLWGQVTIVSASISITGDITDAEVTQLYVSFLLRMISLFDSSVDSRRR